jgi:NAD-dependent deacetylase
MSTHREYPSIAILTGAGISAESGLATFRASDGLWCNHRIEDVATPEGFAHNPALVHQFYNMRRAQLREVAPNAAHIALARLCAEWPGQVFLITQNVDNLHQRAQEMHTPHAASMLIPMHGELTKIRCTACDMIFEWHDDLSTHHTCPHCATRGTLRPHIVWFGEMPLALEIIDHALHSCSLFLSIGTSGNVYPAAGFVRTARMAGSAHTAELNLEPSAGQSLFHERCYGPATQVIPEYVERILSGNHPALSTVV